MRRQLILGLVVRPSDIKAKTRPGTRLQSNSTFHLVTVLLHVAGKKPLRMSQISRKVYPLRYTCNYNCILARMTSIAKWVKFTHIWLYFWCSQNILVIQHYGCTHSTHSDGSQWSRFSGVSRSCLSHWLAKVEGWIRYVQLTVCLYSAWTALTALTINWYLLSRNADNKSEDFGGPPVVALFTLHVYT